MEICVQTMSGYDRTLELARWCEANDVPALAVADHYLSGDLDSDGYDQLVILGGIARETTDLELCTLVSPLTFRHPAVHLKTAVTLDQMSGGRFTLGVGTGWMEAEHDAFGLELPEMGERFARLEETLAYLRAAIGDEPTGFDGEYYQLAGFLPQPQPSNLRLVVGGGGAKKTPILAGRFADEFNVSPAKAPWVDRIDVAKHAATEAGRDPEALVLSTAFPALIAETRAGFEELLADHVQARKTEPKKVLEAYGNLGIPHGTIEEAADGFSRLADMGITRVYLQGAFSELDAVAATVEAVRAAAG